MGSIVSSTYPNEDTEGGAVVVKAKPLHVQYKAPDFPIAMILMSKYLPSFLMRKLVLSGGAPKPPKDCVDLLSRGMDDEDEYDNDPPMSRKMTLNSPYEMTEIVPDRLWRVRYRYVADDGNQKAMKELFGVDLLDPTLKDRAVIVDTNNKDNEEVKANEALQELIVQSQKCVQMHETMNQVEKCRSGYCMQQDMIVVRVGSDNNGNDDTASHRNLLLYNVCRLHPQLLEWLQSLGGMVEWIVSGSSSHTNMIPLAAKVFPNAKLVLASAANDKCMYVGCRPADYLYDTPEGLQSLQDALSSHSILIHHIKGDVLTQSLFVRAHKHLLECDILYDKFGVTDEQQWRKKCNDSLTEDYHMCGTRCFYYSAIGRPTSTSPNGYLPSFRFMAMDPTCPFAAFMLDQPKHDGSSCTDMAESLRALVQLDGYDHVLSVHSYGDKPMPKEEFCDLIDKSWKWLDGQSLSSSY